ncbi:hypothetical protein GE061_013350 [Apolygus lucorum]|uniref:Uncharacterized protein n=1 Tax=Apolygus lucorum TaxID=248454 RepID=A0A8S9XQC7_APOLU|nr:hypothetical protein GE061_013350 [Apolygus lucorum]
MRSLFSLLCWVEEVGGKQHKDNARRFRLAQAGSTPVPISGKASNNGAGFGWLAITFYQLATSSPDSPFTTSCTLPTMNSLRAIIDWRQVDSEAASTIKALSFSTCRIPQFFI